MRAQPSERTPDGDRPAAHSVRSADGNDSARPGCIRGPSHNTYWAICVGHGVDPFWRSFPVYTAVQRRRCSAAMSRRRYARKRSSSAASAHTIQRRHPPFSLRARTTPRSIQSSRLLGERSSLPATSRAHPSSGPSAAREEPRRRVFPSPSWRRSVWTRGTLQCCPLRKQGRVAVGLELAGNGIQRPACPGQFLDAGTHGGIVRALPIAGNGTYQHAFCLAASRPSDPDPHLLTRTLRLHLYPLDHVSDHLFAVRIRRRGSPPQRRNVGGELANGRAFLCGQDVRLRLEEAVLLLLELLLGL